MARSSSSMRRMFLISGLLAVVFLFAAWTEATRPIKGPHSSLELAALRSGDELPWVVGEFFATSGRCSGCHGHDVNGIASVDAEGNDVNLVDDWRSTMMANSAKDPFFRAKLDHEVLVNPGHGPGLENKCLSCHAPMGVHEQRMLGAIPFTRAMLDTSALGLDGVSCLSCHMQSPGPTGFVFSGDLQFDSARVYGPYADDQIAAWVMESFVGWTPGFGEHMVDSRNCAGCHTLVTQTVDLSGQYTGDEFVEQATYHEWKNSIYSSTEVHCNSCHMPRIPGPIILAADYAWLSGQSPFGLHHLVGGNVHMLKLLKANREVLGITATDAQFDSTIMRSRKLLQERTLDVSVTLNDRTDDTAFYAVRLTNRAGHRFPSGYPSRRAFITFAVVDAVGDTVFKSGVLRSDHEVEGHDVGYEPHYDVISSSDQVQIYELVMGDVNDNVTTVLERAKSPLKDNRMVPLGFSTNHPSYDTTRIAGIPTSDLDFNRGALGEEGSGTDIVRYHIPLNGNSNGLRAIAKVYYQPVPPGWNAEMFAFYTPDIDSFRDMLAATDGTPVLVAADSLSLGPAGVAERAADRIVIYPNPTSDGWVTVGSTDRTPMEVLSVHDARGRLVPLRSERISNGWRVQLPQEAGLYFIQVRIAGQVGLKRVVRGT
ncbi:MAG: T9SS type A sorting domain-containing protein [Flavobacteriales bacterium]